MRSQHIKCDSCGFSCLCPKIRNLPSDQTCLCLNRKRGLISTRWHSRNRKIHHSQGIVSTDIPLRQGQVPSFKIPEVTEPWPLSSLCLCPWIGRVSGQFEVLRSFCRHLLSLFHLDFISNWFDWQSIWYYWLVYLLHTIPWTSHNKLKKKQ